MTDKDIAKYARAVAQRLLVRQSGDMDAPDTWIKVALSFGCRVHAFHDPGGCLGEYAPAGDGQGVITYNDAATPPAQARVVCHEIAHHILMTIVPGYLFGDYCRCYYDDDAGDIRHRIARRVEEMCFRRAG